MGVTGLWKLIEPCGKPVPVETLEGKIIAVDISIWLHQVIKGFQDNKGSALNNAHLLGLFHRLCKLLYYRVRPVFIFDGCVPQLKRETIAKRQQQRSKLNNEADRIQALLLQSLAKEKVVQQALGPNAELLFKSPIKASALAKSAKSANEDDLFKLPELPSTSASSLNDTNEDDQSVDPYSSETDSSMDESHARNSYNANLQNIDVKSEHFRNLPADVRHEILTDIKETRKQSSWGRLHELPARSDDFASFQMQRLLKRRAVQESLEKAEQEMGGATLTYAELSEFFSEEGIVTPTAIEQSTRQISSDEHTRFLLVRDLRKKALLDVKKEENAIKCEIIEEVKEDDDDDKPSTSTQVTSLVKPKETSSIENQKDLGAEYDADMALALALSLEDSQRVYDEKDYDFEGDKDLKLNREQSKQLKHTAKGPARAYMIEYAGMNEDEVDNIMEKTQLNNTQNLERLLNFTSNENIEEDDGSLTKNIHHEKKEESIVDIRSKEADKLQTIDVNDSDTDSDLEEVAEEPQLTKSSTHVPGIEINLNSKELVQPDDDLFADIFEEEFKDKDSPKSVQIPSVVKENHRDSEEDKVKAKECEKELIVEEIKSKQDLKSDENSSSILDNGKKIIDEVKNTLVEPPAKDEPTSLDAILKDLKRQTLEVKNIKLEAVRNTESAIVELSSDDEPSKVKDEEVIELIDSDDNQKMRALNNKTPSKKKSITEYFETSYVIKRTPETKPNDNDCATPPGTPKVPKPFFVKRTPKSGKKRSAEQSEQSDESETPTKKSSKAAKSLFEEPSQPTDPEDLIKDAAEVLRSQKTNEELQEMATSLAKERKELETERNRQDRMGMSISQRMRMDCQELLRLFGIPYIVAPMEAEAQCAFLNAIELTHGTITDDSDIWLFGGRTVYKNFFAQNKHVLEFRAENIEQTFNCNRNKLIQLACLVGSDYTTGVHGIGAVTALEILASFTNSSSPSGESGIRSVLSTLVKFRDWWQAHKQSKLPPGTSARLSLQKKLKNIELHEGFPSTAVVEAYLTPTVDENRDAFSWGSPDVESIREFTRKTFGWTTSKTDDLLTPVMKKINEKKVQNSIRNYFTAKSAVRVQQPKVSKRVQTAIDKMSGKLDIETPEKPKKTRTKRSKPMPQDPEEGEAKGNESSAIVVPKKRTKSKPTVDETKADVVVAPSTRKTPRIPNTKEVIPQREKDLEEQRQNKAKAAEILKKSQVKK